MIDSEPLSTTLRQLQSALDDLRMDLAQERARRIATVIGGVAISVLLVVLIVSNISDTRRLDELTTQRETDRCESGNASREAIVEAFDQFTDALANVAPATPRTPDQQLAHAKRVEAFKADLDKRLEPLGQRDCALIANPED